MLRDLFMQDKVHTTLPVTNGFALHGTNCQFPCRQSRLPLAVEVGFSCCSNHLEL